MPPGATISMEEASRRLQEGDRTYLPELENEPLLVQVGYHGGRNGYIVTQQLTSVDVLYYLQRAANGPGLYYSGANAIRRGTVQAIAEVPVPHHMHLMVLHLIDYDGLIGRLQGRDV